MTVIFSYLADHLRLFCTKVRTHMRRMAEVVMKLITLGMFMRIVCHGAVSQLASEDLARTGGNNGVLLCVSQDIIRQEFAVGIFRVLF